MKVTVKGRVHCSNHDPEHLVIFNCDMSGYDYICLGEQDFEVEVPELEQRIPVVIAKLREAQTLVEQKAAEKIASLEEEIGKLARLTYKGDCHVQD